MHSEGNPLREELETDAECQDTRSSVASLMQTLAADADGMTVKALDYLKPFRQSSTQTCRHADSQM